MKTQYKGKKGGEGEKLRKEEMNWKFLSTAGRDTGREREEEQAAKLKSKENGKQ